MQIKKTGKVFCFCCVAPIILSGTGRKDLTCGASHNLTIARSSDRNAKEDDINEQS